MTSDESKERIETIHRLKGFDPIQSQHKIFLDTLFEWEHSRLPWKRWFAKSFHQQLMERCAVAEWLHKGL